MLPVHKYNTSSIELHFMKQLAHKNIPMHKPVYNILLLFSIISVLLRTFYYTGGCKDTYHNKIC